MAVVAHGDRPVAGFDPGGIVIVHDMTIRAGRRIVREVGGALCIDERIGADSNCYPDCGAQNTGGKRSIWREERHSLLR